MLLGILLLAVLLSTMCLGYARHVVVSANNAEATVAVQQAEGVADSGIAWAKQSLLAAGGRTVQLDMGSDAMVAIDLVDNGSTLRTLTIRSSASGVMQAMQGSLEIYGTVVDSLPELTDAAKSAVLAHGSLIQVVGAQSYSNTTLTGIVYLRNGSSLTLTNCIVNGSIVSEPAISGAWSEADATSLVLAGSVVIESDAALAGCSIIAPDAAVSGNGTEAVQIEGCIVADTLTLTGWGSVHGLIATTGVAVLNRAVDLPGAGREPRTWPIALHTGAESIGRVSFPRPVATSDQQDAIENFTFPPDPP